MTEADIAYHVSCNVWLVVLTGQKIKERAMTAIAHPLQQLLEKRKAAGPTLACGQGSHSVSQKINRQWSTGIYWNIGAEMTEAGIPTSVLPHPITI